MKVFANKDWIPVYTGMTKKLVKLKCHSREGGNPEGLINKIAQFRYR